jgi:hypothetical protein
MTPPDSASYQVVFDLRRQLPGDWWGAAMPLAIAFVLLRFARRGTSRAERILRPLITGFAVFLSLVIAAATTLQYVGLRRALEGGNVRWVEGTVTEFIPEDVMTKRREQFVVVTPTGRYGYSYASSLGRGGFNGSPFHHGPLRDGLSVRIADVNGVIVSLQVAR